MTYTQTEIVGFGRNVLELSDEEGPSLEGKGLNLDEMKAILTEKLETAENANARQPAATDAEAVLGELADSLGGAAMADEREDRRERASRVRGPRGGHGARGERTRPH